MVHLIVDEGAGRRTVTLGTAPITIGRSAENELQLIDAQVSRRHAELVAADGVWRIRDCGSRLGTFVNGVKVADCVVKAGDRIRVGHSELRLEADGVSGSASGSFDLRQVNALLAGLRALGSSRVLDEVLAIVVDSALELTGAERGFILLADPSGKLTQRLARARDRVTLSAVRISERIPEEVFATGRDRIVEDLLDELHAPHHAGTVALGIRHVLCTPLTVTQYATGGERRIGVLYLDSSERGYLETASGLHLLATEAGMAIDNARLYREVVENERVAEELRVASQMQQALLPPGYYLAGCAELAATTMQCRAVGGDLFDYVARPNGGMAFGVADVAGKGASAALLAAVVQGLLTAEWDAADDPAAVLTRVNRALCRRSVAPRFVTAFYGHLDPGGSFQYCNAGHNAPFLLTRDRCARLDTGGSVLGLFDTGRFDTGHERLQPGDLLMIFSDGVSEAVNAAGEEFGDDRLAACLAPVRKQSATEVLAAIQQPLSDFCGAAAVRDDATLMVVKIR